MSQTSPSELDPGTPLDCHVHFHECYEAETFFDAACANLGAAAAGPAALQGVLLFTEARGDRWFRTFRADGGARRAGRWSFKPTGEETSLVAEHVDGARILLIAGRQIATREGLEVLALNRLEDYPDGLELQEVVDAVLAGGAIAVLPWGFGKWWFRRGGLVRQALQSNRGRPFFLGDNSGRLARTPRPTLFAQAIAAGVWVLPGTDPLPFPAQARRVGSYGCILRLALDPARPARAVIEALSGGVRQPRTYGRLERLGPFLRNQLAMQRLKRRRRPRR